MAKQIIKVYVYMQLAYGPVYVEIPRKAELIHISLDWPRSGHLTFIGDPMEPKEKVPIVAKLSDDMVPCADFPYYIGTAADGAFTYHLFSDRPLDPFNPRHYTN